PLPAVSCNCPEQHLQSGPDVRHLGHPDTRSPSSCRTTYPGLPAFGCELVLIVLRPTMKITNAIENKYRLCRRSSGARLLCLNGAAGDNQQQKDRNRMNFHSHM